MVDRLISKLYGTPDSSVAVTGVINNETKRRLFDDENYRNGHYPVSRLRPQNRQRFPPPPEFRGHGIGRQMFPLSWLHRGSGHADKALD